MIELSEPLVPEHPELESLLDCCEDSAAISEYLYFDEGKMFAQFIFNQPVAGFDFEFEINIYLRDKSLIQILFGKASRDEVEELIAMYMFISPHIIQTVTWYVAETGLYCVATCADAHC